MRLNGKKIGTYSLIVTAIIAVTIFILFGPKLFGCTSGNIANCIGSISVAGLIAYLSVYTCIWFFVRFGNIGGVKHDDQF